jgi:integrase
MSVKLRIKKVKDNGKSLYLDIYHNGQRSYEFLNITIAKDDEPEKKKEKLILANLIRSQRDVEVISRNTDYTPKHKKKVDFLLFCESFLNDYTKKDKRMVRYAIEKFNAYILHEKILKPNKVLLAGEVNKNMIEGFRDYLTSTEGGLTGETPQNYFTRFRKVLKSATQLGIFNLNPADNIVFKRSDESLKLKKQILTADELRLLSNKPCGNDMVKRAFLFACHTGLGMAELRMLKWSNIDNGRLITNREKTTISINIKLSESALRMIGEKGKPNELIFNLNISDQAISKNLKNWVKSAEIEKNISFYCGRHTYAVLLLMNGNNLKTLADAMGQTSTRHTLKYLNHVDSLKDQATSNLPTI